GQVGPTCALTIDQDRSATAEFDVAGTPGAPTNVAAAPSNGSAVVSWTAPAADGGSPIDAYEVDCAATGNPEEAHTASTDGQTTSKAVSGLTNGVEYACTARAHNANGFGPDSDPSAPFTPTDAAAAMIIDPTAGGTLNLFPDQSFVGTWGQIVLQPKGPSAVRPPTSTVRPSCSGRPARSTPRAEATRASAKESTGRSPTPEPFAGSASSSSSRTRSSTASAPRSRRSTRTASCSPTAKRTAGSRPGRPRAFEGASGPRAAAGRSSSWRTATTRREGSEARVSHTRAPGTTRRPCVAGPLRH